MSYRNSGTIVFALVLVAIPAVVHFFCQGAYRSNNPESFWTGWFYTGSFWIGPISTTVPYVFLALLFLTHCFGLAIDHHFRTVAGYRSLNPKSRKAAFCGAGMSWLSMMAFTVFIISQTYCPKISAFVGIVMIKTFFSYLPLLVPPYFIGVAIGEFWIRREEKKDRETPTLFR